MSVLSPQDEAVSSSDRQERFFARLLPICAFVFLGFLSIGVPLPVLPLQISGVLGYGPLIVGLVMGIQSIATLATRHYAGTLSDAEGPKKAVLQGLVACATSGGIYLLSLLAPTPMVALATIMLGRLLLGFGESLLIAGALSWGVSLAGPQSAGRVISWNGIAMYGALAAGAPAGIVLSELGGFGGVSLAVLIAPLAAILVAARLRPVSATGGARISFHRVLGLVWKPGAGLALSTVGYGGIASFGTLYFQSKGWTGASAALLAFGGAYIFARLLFSHLPDKHGGVRIAAIFLLVEIVGQALLWTAFEPWMALLGAALTGFGFSLVFPSFGVEAVARVPAQNRGVAMAAYVAFFDVALGVVGPLSGATAGVFGYPSLFLFGALSAAVALALAIGLGHSARKQGHH